MELLKINLGEYQKTKKRKHFFFTLHSVAENKFKVQRIGNFVRRLLIKETF